jgi:hypothetical protein
MMFCSTCGKPVPANLHYCSSCGSPTDNGPQTYDPSIGRLFIIGGMVIGVAGILSFFIVLGPILGAPIDTSAKVALAASYLIAITVLSSVPMYLGLRHVNSQGRQRSPREKNREEGYCAPTFLKPVTTSQLPDGEPGLGSITEPTTRTLDEVPIERK